MSLIDKNDTFNNKINENDIEELFTIPNLFEKIFNIQKNKGFLNISSFFLNPSFKSYEKLIDYHFQQSIQSVLTSDTHFLSITQYILNIYPSIYEGSFKDGLPNGYGIFIEKIPLTGNSSTGVNFDITTYNGEFINGKKHGSIKIEKYGKHMILDYIDDTPISGTIDCNEYLYDGDINNEFDCHGKGKMTMKKTKCIYEGNFINGKIVSGILFLNNNEYFKGEFDNFFPNGKGEYTNKIYIMQGTWINDKLNGTVITTYKNKKYIEISTYSNNVKNSDVEINYLNNPFIKSFKGYINHNLVNYNDLDKLSGKGKLYYNNGDIYDGDISCLKRHGAGLYNNIFCENWENDIKNGKGYIIEQNEIKNFLWNNDIIIRPNEFCISILKKSKTKCDERSINGERYCGIHIDKNYKFCEHFLQNKKRNCRFLVSGNTRTCKRHTSIT